LCRELPDNILTGELLPKFEEAAAIKDSQLQEEQMSALINQLPKYNRILLSWLIVHMEHVIEKVTSTKSHEPSQINTSFDSFRNDTTK
jgi:RalA-binding protein 1